MLVNRFKQIKLIYNQLFIYRNCPSTGSG